MQKGKANDDDESDLAKLFELVAQKNKKLDKLDHIQQHLARVEISSSLILSSTT